MVDCDAVYKEYGGKSVSGAGIEGALSGLAGMVGLGGFWKPVNTQALTNIENAYKNVQSMWTQEYNKAKGNLTKDEDEFAQRQMSLIEEIQKLNDEVLSEEITKNSLYIAILFIALVIVIIYLIVL